MTKIFIFTLTAIFLFAACFPSSYLAHAALVLIGGAALGIVIIAAVDLEDDE